MNQNYKAFQQSDSWLKGLLQLLPASLRKKFLVKTQISQNAEQTSGVNTDSYGKFAEDIITFFSIIMAYQYISLTFQNEEQFEQWSGIEFYKKRTQTGTLFLFGVYLLALKLAYHLARWYELSPVKPQILDEEHWDPTGSFNNSGSSSTKTEEKNMQPQNIVSEKSEKKKLFSQKVSQLIQKSLYACLFMTCTTSYAYISQFNSIQGSENTNKLVSLQHINFLVLWFVTGMIFYSAGQLVNFLTGMRSFHHFGMALLGFVLLIEMGVAHGLNMLIFV